MIDASRHRFDPFYESDGACWCTRGRRHRIHRSSRKYLDTTEGKLLVAYQTGRSAEQASAYWRAHRRNNLLSLLPRWKT